MRAPFRTAKPWVIGLRGMVPGSMTQLEFLRFRTESEAIGWVDTVIAAESAGEREPSLQPFECTDLYDPEEE